MDGHRTRGGTGHTTQNQRSSCRQGNTHQTQGNPRDTPQAEHTQTRRSLQIHRCHSQTGSDKHDGLRKSHSSEPQPQPAPGAPSTRVMHCKQTRCQCRHPRRHRHRNTNTDTHRCTRFPIQHGPAFKETGASGKKQKTEHLLLLKKCLLCR